MDWTKYLRRHAHLASVGSTMRIVIAIAGTALPVLVVVLWLKIIAYVDPWEKKVKDAGYVEKTAHIDNISLHYVEGPNNGPPLVLLHAQFLDWFSYSRVLPTLAKSFHVYDIDYPGHGSTVTPESYPMTANQIGRDLGAFMQTFIGKPAFLTGNSSGGLLAVWLAANRPTLVKAVLLEDPPLFTSEFPNIKRTIAYRAFKTSYDGAHDHANDFLLYWIHGNAKFFERNVGPGSAFLLTEAIKAYRVSHPEHPADIGLIRNDTIRLMVRGLDRYDPRFGAAFYDGSWNAGFDQATALQKIACPVLLVQANYTFLPDGTLNGAMAYNDAHRAATLLHNGAYIKVDATHVINIEKPTLFIRLVQNYFLSQRLK